MKPTDSGLRRQKIILYYTLAVVLPGIILGYMAYRGIRNDQALREKERGRRLEMISQAFFAAVDSSFIPFIKEHITDSVLPKSRKDDPSLLAFFVNDTSGSKKLIAHQLLYLPAELISVRYKEYSRPINLKVGSRMEFIEKRYPEALRFYQDKTIKATNPAEKMQTMVASARLYNKMNQPGKAKALYDEIRKDYQGSLLNGQIPVELIAGLEILKINQANGEHEEMRNNSRQYLELLLHPLSEYDETQFEMFYQSLKEIIPKTDPVIDSMFSKLDIQRARTEFLIQIINGSNLITNNNKNFYKNSNYRMFTVPIISEELSAVYLSWNNKSSLQRGIVIDFPVYIRSLSATLIKSIDPNYSINIKIEDNNGKPIFSGVHKDEPGYISFPFPANLPKWKLLINENKPGFISTLLKEGSGIYLFIFILIALLMVLGFVFTLYSLNMELRLNKLKSEFISNVSHELKSPLTSIRMMTEMLYHKRVLSEERKHEYYSSMLEESEHLSHLIDNILDFSRMDDDRKKYDFTDLDMNELLIKFLESFRESLPESGFDIRYNPPDRVPLIKADKNAILQVFYNLIDNAIKFSGTSRQIDISLFHRADTLLFCVKDYGIGIAGKDQEKVFDRFYRSDEPQRLGIKGSGIGLTIVEKIIAAHKGHLTLESKHGEGSTFCVHMPINKNTGP